MSDAQPVFPAAEQYSRGHRSGQIDGMGAMLTIAMLECMPMNSASVRKMLRRMVKHVVRLFPIDGLAEVERRVKDAEIGDDARGHVKEIVAEITETKARTRGR